MSARKTVPATQPITKVQYRREIDGLRGIAVLPVVFFHAGYEMFEGGYVGVDVFFVISGYLITTMILTELDTQSFSLTDFYERRARRILPALLLVIVACLPAAWVLLTPSNLKEFAQSALASSTLTANVFFWLKTGYFETRAETKPLLHMWSLAVEWQFYLMFPLFLCAILKLGRTWAVRLLVASCLTSLAGAQWAIERYPEFAFFMLPTRLWELLIGSFVALLWLDRARTTTTSSKLFDAGGLLGFFLIGSAIFAFEKSTPYPSLYALVPCTGAALILYCAGRSRYAAGFLSHGALVGLGKLSYSIYLWHWPIFVFLRHVDGGRLSFIEVIAAICLSLVLAYLSWRFVERPFRRSGIIPRRQFSMAALACISSCIAFGLAGHLSKGFWNIKATDGQKRVLLSAQPSDLRDKCHTGGANFKKPASACKYFTESYSWAVLGDSHAVELAHALASGLMKRNAGLHQFSFSGCAPMYLRNGEDGCSRWTREAVSHILSDSSIRFVVVSYRINAYLFGDHLKNFPASIDNVGETERSLRWTSFVKLLETLKASGKKVIAVLPVPELGLRLDDLIFRFGMQSGDIAGIAREWWHRRDLYVLSRERELARSALLVDPTNLFCDASFCYATRTGTALYLDDHHLSMKGAHILADEILRQLPPSP